MELSKKFYLKIVVFLLSVVLFNGCSLTGNIIGDWTDTRSLEEYGNQVAETSAVLETYIGKHKDDIRMEFGEPHEVEKRIGSKAVYNQLERVEFDEIWDYIYRRGIPGINAEGSIKTFFFKGDIVVAVDAS